MLLEITLAIVFAKILNLAFEKIKQPGVIGELVAGILLGPCIIGALSGSSLELFGSTVFTFNLDLTTVQFKEIAMIGVIFLLFTIGLETNIADLKKTRRTSFFVAIFGIVIPFVIGCFAGILFGMNSLQCAVIGTIFLATSTVMAIRILSDMNMLSSRIGLALYGILIINDVIAMIIFAIVFSTGNSFSVFLQIAIFFTFTLIVGIFVVKYIKRRTVSRKTPMIVVTIGLILCFLFAAFAENMGITAIIGAFIAGIFIGRTPQAVTISEYIKTIGYAFFIPLFFVYIGASFNFMYLLQSEELSSLLFFIAVFVVLGLSGNFIGGFIGSRVAGLTRKEALSVGLGTMPVMGVALIVVSTGIDKGIFGDPSGILANKIRTATLFLIITSCILAPALLKRNTISPLSKQFGKTKTKLSLHLPARNPSGVYYVNKEKNDKYIQYIIGVVTVLICAFAIKNLDGVALEKKIFAMIGIFIGTMMGFLTVRYLFYSEKFKQKYGPL